MMELFGQVAADVLIEKLNTASRSTNTRYVIDSLRADERRAVFDALFQRAGRTLVIPVDGQAHELRALDAGHVDVIPVLVANRDAGADNITSDGWACKLRDHYTAGAKPTQPRALLTFTPESNETQRSASESAVDRELLSLAALAKRLLARHGIASDGPLACAIEIYLQQQDDGGSASAQVAQIGRFLEAAGQRPAAEQGMSLAELGCFFPDSRADWHAHLVENTAVFREVQAHFSDPLKDAGREINALLEDEGAALVMAAGREEMTEVDFAGLRRRQDDKRRKSGFRRDGILVTGASHYHLVKDVDEPVLVIAAESWVTIELHLDRPLEQSNSYVHLVGWDRVKSRPQADRNAVRNGKDGQSVVVNIAAPARFAVWRLIVSRGPRSFVRHQDCIWLAVYRTAAPCIAFESECRLSLEHQAWEQQGRESCFEGLMSDETSFTVQVKRPADGDARLLESDGLGGDEALSEERIGGDGYELDTRVHWLGEIDEDETDHALGWLEEAIYRARSNEQRTRMLEALQSHERYPAAIHHLSLLEDVWLVRMAGDLRRSVLRWNQHGEEDAVGRLLGNPEVAWLVRQRQGDGFAWEEQAFEAEPASLNPLLDCRRILFERLHESAMTLRQVKHGHVAAVSLGLIDLQAHATLITDYLDAWIAVYEQATPGASELSSLHRVLLTLDTLVERGEQGNEIDRLTVLPTHPWLLWSLLCYQQTMSKEIQGMSTRSETRFDLQLTEGEAAQLVRPAPFDDWYGGVDGSLHLCRIDGPPFHWSFVPEEHYRRHGGLDYLSRVVRHKLHRYLRMHRHLAHRARTMRIGFINPGDGAHLLEGIRMWVRDQINSGDEARIPDVEVLLFSTRGDISSTGAAFDELFKGAFTASRDEATHVLMQKLRYLKLDREGPGSERDSVHICFVRDLVRDADFQARDRRIEDGWDGCFGDGVLATSLRSSRIDGPVRRTERGLWIAGSERNRGRRALAQIATLLRGCSQGSVDPALGLFWGASVPTLAEQRSVYAHSNWVVHLDRALGLEVFRDFEKQMEDQDVHLPALPLVVEYSDQEEPDTPGYDTITVTRHAQPYIDQLAAVLRFVGLPIPEDAVARRCGEGLIRHINAVSGTWALDFIEGNMSQDTSSTRLKGHAGVALSYRWLQRVEARRLRYRFGGAVVPVYLSLDEIIRATPSVGLPLKDGLFVRSREDGNLHKDADGRVRICDDLLILYLTPVQDGYVHMVGRVVEIKLAKSPRQYEDKAVEQVRNTREVLQAYLSGDATRHDHMFRSKQLSLLLKSRIEQTRIMDPTADRDFERIDLNQLSAALASGNYHVDYCIGGDGGQDLFGDVFLLHTAESKDRPGMATIHENNGVRVIELTQPTLQWLAFQPEDSVTLAGPPADTLPSHLGSHTGDSPVMRYLVSTDGTLD